MFDVYVEGATGTSLGAVRELANAMAARYGVAAADVHARLTRGRFRVKADVDRATAEIYLRDLESIGARVRIERATGARGAGTSGGAGAGGGAEPTPRAMRSSLPLPDLQSARSSLPAPDLQSARSSLPPPVGARTTRSPLPPQSERRTTRSSLPPQPEARGSASVLPPQPEARPAGSVLPPQPEARPATSSLPPPIGAQPASPPIATTLGALDRSGLLSLATLDDEPATPSPSDGLMPASMGPAAPRPPQPARSRLEPIDPFAPPEAAVAEQLLDLADDDVAYRRSTTPAAPDASAARRREPPLPPDLEPRRASVSKSPDAARLPAVDIAAGGAPSTGAAAWGSAAPQPKGGVRVAAPASSRMRFAAGLAIAIVLGYVPADLVAAWRERVELGAIDEKVAAAQSVADAPDSYAALDAFRAEQLDAKRSARRTIAVIAFAVWVAAGGALVYGWSRLPWQRPD